MEKYATPLATCIYSGKETRRVPMVDAGKTREPR